MGNPVMRILFC